MTEVWLPVSGYEGFYEVSSFGNFRSLDRIVPHTEGKLLRNLKGRQLVKTIDKQGRNYVTFSKNGKKNKCRVHLIVAEHFLGQRPKGFDVCHNDGNASNNHFGNLRYDTHKNNMGDMVAHERSQRGEKNFNTKMTKEQALEVKHLRSLKMTYKNIAMQLSLTFEQVRSVCVGRAWHWV